MFVVSTSSSDSLSESHLALRAFFLNDFFGLFEEDGLFLISGHSAMIYPGFRQLKQMIFFSSFPCHHLLLLIFDLLYILLTFLTRRKRSSSSSSFFIIVEDGGSRLEGNCLLLLWCCFFSSLPLHLIGLKVSYKNDELHLFFVI